MYLKFENLQPVYFLPRPDVTAKRTFLWLAICASASLSTRCTGRDGTIFWAVTRSTARNCVWRRHVPGGDENPAAPAANARKTAGNTISFWNSITDAAERIAAWFSIEAT